LIRKQRKAKGEKKRRAKGGKEGRERGRKQARREEENRLFIEIARNYIYQVTQAKKR
jgi:hypothetical protein